MTSSYLGYERFDVHAPAILAALLRWRHRGTFLVLWYDITDLGAGAVTLKSAYGRYSAVLRPR